MVMLGGCAPVSVGSHVAPQIDFLRYRTFDWGPVDPLPVGDVRLEESAFFQDHMQGAVERQMAFRGYERAEPGDPADLQIHVHAVIHRRLEVNELDAGRGLCSRNACVAGVTEFQEGTLVVDVIDTQTNRLIWRGWARNTLGDTLQNQDRLATRIDHAVAALLDRLPRRR